MRPYVPIRRAPWWRGGVVAVATIFAAWAARSALSPFLHQQAPYALLVVPVLASAMWGGWRAAAFTALVGGLIANFSFVGGGKALVLGGAAGWAFALYVAESALLIGLAQVITASLARQARVSEHLAIVGAEFRHRMKNLLAVSQALVQQTGRTAHSVGDYREKVVGRLQALSRAQDLLSERTQTAAPLRRVVEQTLSPFDIASHLDAPLGGPLVLLPPDMAVALTLLLNELATNSLKYGALSAPEGRLRLRWTRQDKWTVLEWKEMDGPSVTPPQALGFGSRLFAAALPPEQGSAVLTYEADGVRCEIRLATAPSQSWIGSDELA